MRSKMLVNLTIVSVLALSLSACVITPTPQVVIVTATPETVMAKTFNQMMAEAMAEVPVISPEEAHRRMQEDPRTLVIDPRDAADIPVTGIIPGAMNISYGALTYMADNEVPQEWREPELADRSRPIITACEVGPLGALAGKLLKDMGFTNVSILEGGTQAWKDAGFPTQQEAAAQQMVEEEQFVEAAMANENAFQSGDVDRIIEFYAEDAVSMPPGFPVSKGKEAIEADLRFFFDEFDLEREFTLVDYEVTGEYATRTGEWTQTLTPKAGGDPVEETGRCVLGFKKVGDEWKVAWEIWSYYEPPTAE